MVACEDAVNELYDLQKKLLDKQETLRNRLLKDLQKAQTDYYKQREVVDSIDPEKDRNGKKTEAALKKLQQLSDKMDTLQDKYISGTLLLSKSAAL